MSYLTIHFTDVRKTHYLLMQITLSDVDTFLEFYSQKIAMFSKPGINGWISDLHYCLLHIQVIFYSHWRLIGAKYFFKFLNFRVKFFHTTMATLHSVPVFIIKSPICEENSSQINADNPYGPSLWKLHLMTTS